VNVTGISGNETTTAARNGFAAHRFPSLSGMSTKQAARRDSPTSIDGRYRLLKTARGRLHIGERLNGFKEARLDHELP